MLELVPLVLLIVFIRPRGSSGAAAEGGKGEPRRSSDDGEAQGGLHDVSSPSRLQGRLSHLVHIGQAGLATPYRAA